MKKEAMHLINTLKWNPIRWFGNWDIEIRL
jgi:hypothetical protein